jgi:ABC-type nickel/cobalt efflux system permease component RcnA
LISIPTEIQITQSVVYFIAAAIPIYLTQILKKRNDDDNKHFKILTIIFAGFVLMQGIYHAIGALGFSLLAKGVLEPVSFVILFSFGIIFLVSKIRTKSEKEVKAQ